MQTDAGTEGNELVNPSSIDSQEDIVGKQVLGSKTKLRLGQDVNYPPYASSEDGDQLSSVTTLPSI